MIWSRAVQCASVTGLYTLFNLSRLLLSRDAERITHLCELYECIEDDTEKALTLMNKDGVVVWHDPTWKKNGYGVNKYLKKMRRAGFDVQLIVIGPFDYSGLAILLL